MRTSADVPVAERLTALTKGFGEYVSASQWRGPSSKRSYMYASSRRRCLRRSVLEATEPDAFGIFDADAKARMWRGSQRERDLVIDLKRVGQLTKPRFDVIGEQERVRITDREGRMVISGRIDGRIAWEDGANWPLEVKAWSPFLTDRIDSFADLYESPWTWSGAHQLLSYLYSKPEPHGVLVLDRPGVPKFINVSLEENLEQMEAFLRDAESCAQHIDAGTLPDFIDDPQECGRCPAYGALCNPPLSAKDVTVITDPEVEAQLKRWHDLRPAGREFNDLDDTIKKRLRGIENAIAGPFSILGKWQKGSRLEVPADLKKQYTVTDPKGRFLLTVEKL